MVMGVPLSKKPSVQLSCLVIMLRQRMGVATAALL